MMQGDPQPDEQPVTPVVTAPAAAPPTAVHGPETRSLFRELMTITVGVLIALSLEGLVQWGQDRMLVRQARSTILLEIADNRREVDSVLSSVDARRTNLALALRFANELLEKRDTDINEVQLGFNVADLSTASWDTAGSTGALGHMDYGEVQRYADLYSVQAMYSDRQKGTMERLAAAATMFSDRRDPKTASPDDIQLFRRQVLAMHSDLMLEEQLGRRLLEIYDQVLASR
jgi:hypothetical protein